MSKASEHEATLKSLGNHGKTVVDGLPPSERRKLLDAIRTHKNGGRVLGQGMQALVAEALKN